MNYFLSALKKYAVFDGRAQRAEYWYFTLFNGIIAFVIGFISGTIGIVYNVGQINFGMYQIGILSALYALAIVIPSIAVGVRRLHDVGKSGWMYLLSFIPIVGAIWLLVLFVTDSEPGENKYGANPKDVVTV